MTEVTLTDAARDWLAAQGSEMILRVSTRHGCCGGQAGVVVAEAGGPASPQDYDERTLDGIRVHVARNLGPGPYRVDVEGFFRWRRLVVEGEMGQ